MFGKFLLWLLLPLIPLCQINAEEEPAIPSDFPITEAERARLNRDKILVSRSELRQSFSAYLGKGLPQFITSDAVLNAYHVLFEETVRIQEIANEAAYREYFPELLRWLAGVDQSYQGDKKLFAAAKTRAQFVVGVAVRLLDLAAPDLPAALGTSIEAEVERIKQAEGQHKPLLLGPPEPDFLGFDYSVFKPVGFYTQSPKLERYFRAVRWLQLVPFRLNRKEELLAFYMMSTASTPAAELSEEQEKREKLRRYPLEQKFLFAATAWKSYGLASHDASLVDFQGQFNTPQDWKVDRKFLKETAITLKEKFRQSKMEFLSNDRLRETIPNATEVEVRILSAVNLPEDKALRTSSKIAPDAGYPAGLEFASWLDQPLANRLLAASPGMQRKPLLDAAWPNLHPDPEKETKPSWDQISEYDGVCWQYMGSLRALCQLDERVPAFMLGEAWQRKTLITTTASWAQHRHAWSLQAKEEFLVMGIPKFSPVFVEPVSEFYQKLAEVADRMSSLATEAEAIGNPLETLLEHVRDLRATFDLETVGSYNNLLDVGEWLEIEVPQWDKDIPPTNRECLDVLDRELKLLAASDVTRLKALMRHADKILPRTSGRWHDLQTMCLRLALLSEQQLAHRVFAERDVNWLKYLGGKLGRLMLYEHNSSDSPRDDAPRIAKITTDPVTHQVFQVGIGRPRLLFVLYPWEGKEILCQGAVMPYHEISTTTPLTDTEWLERFQGKTRPAVPTWLEGFVPVENVDGPD